MVNISAASKRTTRATYVAPNQPKPIATRELAAYNLGHKIWTIKKACAEAKCSTTTAKRWRTDFNKGRIMHATLGRPSLVGPEHLAEVCKEVEKGSTSKLLVSGPKFAKLLQGAAAKTADDEHKVAPKLSKRYTRDQKRKCGFVDVNAEIIDNPHKVALHDPRHAASFAALLCHLRTKVPDGLFVNIDKTSFAMKMEDKENTPAVLSGQRQQTCKTEDPYPTSTKPGNCTIHLYVVANDGGKLADMVYVVKDKNMPKDKTDLFKTPYLDGSTGATGMAYLMFVGDSSPNTDTGLLWLYEHIVVPFVTQLRERDGHEVKIPASLTVDGDPRQLQVLTSTFVMDALGLANIILSKSPASCTPIFQPLDVGLLFLAAKSRFHALLHDPEYTPNAKHANNLKAVFKAHLQNYPHKLKKNSKPSQEMTAYFKNAQRCLLIAADSLRKTAACATVEDSFKKAGVVPFDPALIRDKCKYYLTEEQKANFLTAVPDLAEIFGRNSELKESDFDKCNIPTNNTSKDDALVHQRRALLLYAPHVLTDLKRQADKDKK